MSYWTTLGAAVLFILVLSIDLFACGFGYGASKTHVPFRKVLVINLIGSFVMAAGMICGHYLGEMLNKDIAMWLSFAFLFGLGIYKILYWFFTRKTCPVKKVSLIAWSETIVFGIILSIDGFVVGVGATIDSFEIAFIVTAFVISLFSDHVVFWLGQFFGAKVTEHICLNLSWISGAFLMIIATVGLFW
ncbi:MAG: manganese efflux pump [Christensenellaceae bacterium]|nr:manganese efflux pump [Christensenellaceae bacterium]